MFEQHISVEQKINRRKTVNRKQTESGLQSIMCYCIELASGIERKGKREGKTGRALEMTLTVCTYGVVEHLSCSCLRMGAHEEDALYS